MTKTDEGFSPEEREAMKARSAELKRKTKVDGETDLMNRVAEMTDEDRALALKIHALVAEHAPSLKPKTWYGMPAYAGKDGKPVVFFQAASKFNTRFATLGFSEHSTIDAGVMWPTSWALTEIDEAAENLIIKLLKKQQANL